MYVTFVNSAVTIVPELGSVIIFFFSTSIYFIQQYLEIWFNAHIFLKVTTYFNNTV